MHTAVDDAKLDEAVDRIVASSKGGPRAQAAAKELIAAVTKHPIDRKLVEDTAGRIARIRVTAEGKEGIAAFLRSGRLAGSANLEPPGREGRGGSGLAAPWSCR